MGDGGGTGAGVTMHDKRTHSEFDRLEKRTHPPTVES